MADRVGQQLGNYRLLRLLGEGGFAEVYLGEHIHLGTQSAIKVLHTQLTSDDVDKFRIESRTIARLIHPHIVRVFDFGVEGKTPFLVMDYAPNGTLRQRCPKGTPLPLPAVVSYVKQIADALQYAHDEKLVHRDIKPENMLLGRRNEVLLSDFGIALIAQSSRYQSTQEIAGTVAYMSPEQIQGKPRPASDQYSLGIVVYEWLTGDRPFHGSFTELCTQHMFASPPPLRGKVPTISSDVEQVVMLALAKEPHQRFLSVQAFANALEQASQATFVRPQPPSMSLPPEKTLPAMPSSPSEPAGPSRSTPPLPSTKPASTSPSSIEPPQTVKPHSETPNMYGQQQSPQVGQVGGFTQVSQAKKGPNLALIVGTSVLLLVLVVAGIFLSSSGIFSGSKNTSGNTGGNTNTTGGNNGNTAGVVANGKGCTKIGILLPETATSARWDSKDKPLLIQDIQNAIPGATLDYNNAQGDSTTQQSQAEADLAKGDCILVVAAHDAVVAASIVASAKAKQVPVIAYDRLIQSKDLAYYVSFDNVRVGALQGQYIADHYKDYLTGGNKNVVMINGSQTDNNAILFRQGTLSVLQPLFDAGTLKKVYDQYTPNWNNSTAQTEMDAALTANQNNIQIAYVANDGMANSVIASLKASRLNGRVLVTGQDATVAGLQNILTGDQAMTVYKAITKEAQATADLVKAISNGSDTSSLTNGATTSTSDGTPIPSVLEAAVAVDKTNIASTVLADGYVTKADICQGLPAGTGGIC